MELRNRLIELRIFSLLFYALVCYNETKLFHGSSPMSVTIVDIANKIGVSYTTVSRALNGKKGVGEKTRKRIIEEAERQGYQPNAIARGLVSKSTNTIGLIIPDITNPFFPEVARGVEDASREAGYNVFLCNSNWDRDQERSCLEALRQNRVDGLIINPNSLSNVEFIEKMGIPVVYLNTRIDEGESTYVGVDNVQGAQMATEHLIQCGYKRIAFVGGTIRSYSNNNRLKGYLTALEKQGMEKDSDLIMNGRFETESGYELTKRLFQLPNPPDAVFAGNDIIALGVMQYAQERRLNIPDDFGIIGFDDIYASSLPQIMLSTVAMPKTFLGKKAFEMLLDKIHSEESSTAQYVIKPKLVIRKTTRAIPE